MKKRLEADLISIAHRILKLKNKSDVNQLYLETQKLYEKLAVLRFVENHFGDAKPTIGSLEMDVIIEKAFESAAVLEVEELVLEENLAAGFEELENIAAEFELELEEIDSEKNEILTDENSSEEILEEEENEIEEMEISFAPAFDLDIEEESEEESEEEKTEAPQHKTEAIQISFEDILGGNFSDTFFEEIKNEEVQAAEMAIEKEQEIVPEPKITSLNEKLGKNINIDLNDRIAFTKHLFGNNSEDYNRVLNQLITYNSFYETRDFILEMVKPDYNNWEGKEDYEERFMEIIEKKFL